MRANCVSVVEINAARIRIADHVRRTFVEPSVSLSERAGQPVHLKLEHQQITGSFKLRGAMNAILSLDDAALVRGIVAVSTGNHGRALAYAARAAGSRATICMSELVPQAKIDGIAAEGADIRIIGKSQDEAQREVDRLVAEGGLTMIPPFDHRDVIAGQGTLGLELLEDVPDLATVLVQLSGGGLISGVAAAIKARKPEARIVGVSMERGAAMYASLVAGRPVEVEELPSLADSLGGGIGLENRLTFSMTMDLVDDVILLSENEIAEGIRHCYAKERQIVEGAGAVGVAAVLAGKVSAQGPLALILSGGNIDLAEHQRLVCGGMT
ncbi:hydroxyectoine utilization dehydratase EutB [Algicella marina]|uniref:Hydroxyectoine utilization dehydratase EutB n=1 Tax=Algicella marina TaxID=2683284 RepID=A0A6P1SVC9_9RHOB|nr:hydroxyectoine utilization dehydratase EutB [Algicella marina]QHQ34408.1 hydroxyectoine utilization dehydratase EutB [Algicella marina]